jgi:uncharacterized protein YndB with AHSA1/START domain
MNQSAVTTKTLFSRETTVSITINATPEKIWGILTDVHSYNRWNSTIVTLEGEMRAGGKLKLISTLDPKRTFNLTVSVFEPYTKIVSTDNMMGARTFLLEQTTSGTRFTMTEKIGGPLFPFFARMIPPFDESFNAYAQDLKTEAEKS